MVFVCLTDYSLRPSFGRSKRGEGGDRELGRETAREGGGRRGTPARKPLFSPSRLLIKKKNQATVNEQLSNKSGRDAHIMTYSTRISRNVFLLFS